MPYFHASMLLLGEGSEATEPYNKYESIFSDLCNPKLFSDLCNPNLFSDLCNPNLFSDLCNPIFFGLVNSRPVFSILKKTNSHHGLPYHLKIFFKDVEYFRRYSTKIVILDVIPVNYSK